MAQRHPGKFPKVPGRRRGTQEKAGTPCNLLGENPMDGGAWEAAVYGVAKSRTRLSDFTFTFHFHVPSKS